MIESFGLENQYNSKQNHPGLKFLCHFLGEEIFLFIDFVLPIIIYYKGLLKLRLLLQF